MKNQISQVVRNVRTRLEELAARVTHPASPGERRADAAATPAVEGAMDRQVVPPLPDADVSAQGDLMVKVFEMLKFNQIEGDYAEFGCHSATSFGIAYQASRQAGYGCRLWAFDSFEGLPAQSCPQDWHPGWVEGTYRTSREEFERACAELGMPSSAYRVVPGLYENTLRADAAAPRDLPARISLAFIDCDLYSSTRAVLQFLPGRVGHGTVLAFDDYFCYSSKTLAGARLAAVEFATANQGLHLSPYIQFGCHGMSFVLEDTQLWRGLDCRLLP